MRTDAQIKAEAAQAGQVGVEKLQLEVLLDIRALLWAMGSDVGMTRAETVKGTGYLKTLAERWKKAGRPRKKSGPKPAQ